MIGSVILWFTCYNALMTSDKFLYLFGRFAPAISLIIAMALRLVPRYKAQAQHIAAARRGIGFDVGSGGLITRVRSGLEILSVMVTWALENGVETGDSMLARGYGLKGRTAYHDYRFDARDRAFLVVFVLLVGLSIAAIATGTVGVNFYPTFEPVNVGLLGTGASLSAARFLVTGACLCHAALCALPLVLELREDAKWRSLRSTI
jgi:energy-coupling factor transport system permease protein